MKDDLLFDAQATVEIQQVAAAPQQDVLAVIDGLRAGFVGSGASPKEGPRFE